MSVIPVIIVRELFVFIQDYIWKTCKIADLKEHTASDCSSESFGDIEGYKEDTIFLAVEIKNHIKVDDSVINCFDSKTSLPSIIFRYIITTDKIQKRYVKKNICIINIVEFTSDKIYELCFHKVNIVDEFIYKTDLLSYIELGSNLILTPNSFPSNVSAGKALISGVSNIKSVMATFALGSKFF
jgi:hypothetical protein